MDEGQVWDLLERGGALQRGHFPERGGHAEQRLVKYNGLLDPAGAEALGSALARRLADAGAGAVVVWEEMEDLLLGFVVARELGSRLVRVYNDGGLVDHSPNLIPGQAAVLVTDQVRDASVVRAVRALLESRGGSLVRLGVLVDTGEAAGVAATGLTRPRGSLYPAAECPLCRRGVPLESQEPLGSSNNGDR